MERSRFLASRWLLASLGVGSLALAIDAGLLAAAAGDATPGLLVDDGSVVAVALAVGVEWLLVSWMAVSDGVWRRRAVVSNAFLVFVLGVIYTMVRVDVLLVDDVLFRRGVVGTLSLVGAILAGGVSLGSALIVESEVPVRDGKV